MNEHLPYEEQLQQQWTELPLPDEDLAWEDMKRRLEEDDEERALILWLRPGCMLWGVLLLLLMVGIGWWMMKDKNEKEKEVKTVSERVEKIPEKVSTDPEKNSTAPTKGESTTVKIPVTDSNNSPVHSKVSLKPKKPISKSVIKNLPGTSTTNELLQDSTSFSSAISKSAITVITNKNSTTDSTEIKEKDSTAKPVSKDTTTQKQPPAKNPKNNNFFFTAGLAIQQQLPIGGQKATPYNSVGRSGSLADYIPSVYLRLNRKDKWFLQAEFRYGAPQYTKQFLYEQVSRIDSAINPSIITTTSNSLKKTYYHQLPLTFNYYIKPNWSLGGGAIWNKFYGAIAGQEIIEKNNITQAETVVFNGTVKVEHDSTNIFTKSYFQGIIESQYKWKRLSFGARYAFGLQPYIRFNLPGQPPREEKNSSVQVFLRLELLRPKK